MSKKIALVWLAVLFVILTIILWNASLVENDRSRNTKELKYEEIKDWKIEKSEARNEDGNYVITYTNILGEIGVGGDYLMFYTYHADVHVYCGEDLMYGLIMDKSDTFFDTVSGDAWNCLFVPKEHEFHEITVVVETEYESYVDYIPSFYLGDRLNIVRDEFMNDIVSFLLTVFIFVVGFIIIIYSWIVTKNKANKYDLIYLGIFAVLLSIWFVINMPVVNMIIDVGTIFTYISYILLGSIALPLILFEKKILSNRYNKICDWLCIFIITVQVISAVLQITGTMDMKNSLWLTHISLIISVIILCTLVVLNFITVGWHKLTYISRINMICGALTAIGVIIDLIYFYIDPVNGKNYQWTKLAILIHITSLCYYSMKETQRLMRKGKQAQKFENLAYRDELTGVYNRTACNNDMKAIKIGEDKYTIFMFDLNNLKKCNDSYGHNFGDEYILNSARIIRESFDSIGHCYRIGGDEFCVIAKNVTEDVIEICCSGMDEMVAEYNVEHPLINMSIAYGYATYDSNLDDDLKDTRGRADKLMYKNKIAMKVNEG